MSKSPDLSNFPPKGFAMADYSGFQFHLNIPLDMDEDRGLADANELHALCIPTFLKPI